VVNDLENILERVAAQIAREIAAECNKPIPVLDNSEAWSVTRSYDFSVVLKARLLPLLEVGQALANEHAQASRNDGELCRCKNSGKWEAALSAFEGPCMSKSKRSKDFS